MNNFQDAVRAMSFLLACLVIVEEGRFFAAEDPEPSAKLAVSVTGPRLAGFPLQLELEVTNTGNKSFSYWCGGPGRYPGAHVFQVTITDSQGESQTLALSNGQYMKGSGNFHPIETKTILPAVCRPLTAGTYLLKVSGSRKGRYRDGKKIVTWPAMEAEPIKITIEEDSKAVMEAERELLSNSETDPFARHVAQVYGIDPAVLTWLTQLLEEDWKTAGKFVGHLQKVRRMPPGGDAILTKAVAKHVQVPASTGRDGFLRNVAIFARNAQSDGCIEAMAMMVKSDGSDFFRNAVIDDLAATKHPKAEQVLLELAQDKSSPFYWRAISGLAQHHNQTALKPLLNLTRSDDPKRRAEGVSALWGLRDLPEAKRVLEAALNDPDPEVRHWAKKSLTDEAYGSLPPF